MRVTRAASKGLDGAFPGREGTSSSSPGLRNEMPFPTLCWTPGTEGCSRPNTYYFGCCL